MPHVSEVPPLTFFQASVYWAILLAIPHVSEVPPLTSFQAPLYWAALLAMPHVSEIPLCSSVLGGSSGHVVCQQIISEGCPFSTDLGCSLG